MLTSSSDDPASSRIVYEREIKIKSESLFEYRYEENGNFSRSKRLRLAIVYVDTTFVAIWGTLII